MIRSRRGALVGMATLVVVVVVATAVAGLTNLGPFAPAGASPPTAGTSPPTAGTSTTVPQTGATPTTSPGVSVIDRVGEYSLQITADRAVYRESDPIIVGATFTYAGLPRQIRHSAGGPLGFGIVEPVGGLAVGGFWDAACFSTDLTPGYRLDRPFQKSGGVSSSDPEYERKLAFLKDPVLRLPRGTWHIYVVAEFSEGECGGDAQPLRAEIEIEVSP